MADPGGQMPEEPQSPVEGAKALAVKPEPAVIPLPPPVLSALEKVADQDARAVLQVALSRTTFGFGPDPETAKTIAQAEMHEEDCRLQAFRSSLQNREEQSKRDHEFRKKKLNHQSGLTITVLVVTIGGVGGGLVLSATGNATLGNPVLIASFTLLSSLAGKLLASRDKD
jgi:hypothetical protein